LLKVVDRFFALCLLILRREPLLRCCIFIYILWIHIYLLLHDWWW
jgi:hypothetical protein